MSEVFVGTTSMTIETCGKCSGIFAMSSDYVREARKDHRRWCCPYCGNYWHYTSESKEARLEREKKDLNDRLARERAHHDQTRAALASRAKQLSAQRGVTTRIKNRIAAGVCPCCRRSFQDLARHMAGQHPGFATEAAS